MNDDENQDEFEDDIEYVSKTQMKKEMLALQDLGEAIAELNNEQQAKIPLDESLRKAIEETRKITHKNARKRHMQFIGKLMRKADSDAIRQAYDNIQNDALKLTRQHHQIEAWRDAFLGENAADAIAQFIDKYPQCDRQQLNQSVRAAQKEAASNKDAQGKAPVNTRKLFKFIREVVAQHL